MQLRDEKKKRQACTNLHILYRFSAEEKAKRPQLCYMPFGSGPRSCIGQRLSLLEAKIALIGVLKKLSFVRAPDTEVTIVLSCEL